MPICSTWIAADNYEKYRKYTQVSGMCFTKEGKILIIRRTPEWHLPGGKPENKETPEQTLKREVEEEASVIISECKMIGCFKIDFPNNPNPKEGEQFYQLRYVAIIEKINETKLDPATGLLYERKFVTPEEFNKHIQWGEVSKELCRVACDCFKKWQKTGKL